MRKMMCLCGLLLLTAVCTRAQEAPKVEVFAGYSFYHANPGLSLHGGNANGWNASFNWNWNRWLGYKADFDGHYCCDGQTQHNFLFGPQFTRRGERREYFVHVMAGVSRGNGACGGCFLENKVVWDVGVGMDYRLFKSKKLALRIAQVDYVGTNWANTVQHQIRYSGGVVFRFGER